MLFLCLQIRDNCISSSGLKNFKILIKASSSKSTKLAIASYQLDKNMLQLRYLMLCDALSDLVPQFKYYKKHQIYKSPNLLKVTLLHVCFSRFLNCKYDTKSCKASDIGYEEHE